MKIEQVLTHCKFCGRKLKPFEREHGNKNNDPLCFTCWDWFKQKMNDAGLPTNMEEEYL